MEQNEIRPPWAECPGILPNDIFWRQEGESWALHVWRPYWSSLREEQRERLLDDYKAPQEWREFYDKELQDLMATLDGVGGWILRNNLCPVDEEKPSFISAVDSSKDWQNSWVKKLVWFAAVIGVAIVVRVYIF